MERLVLLPAILLLTLSGAPRAMGDSIARANTHNDLDAITPLGTAIQSLPPKDWGEWSGYTSFDARLFPNFPEFPDQKDQDFSLAFAPENLLPGLMAITKLLEYHYDERSDEASSGLQSDVYAGLQFTANDLPSTTVLAGILYDTDTQAVFGDIETSRRLSESWSVELELRVTNNTDEEDNFYYFRADNLAIPVLLN